MRCGKYSFWGYILKVELTRFVDGLNVVLREKEKRRLSLRVLA